MKMADSQVPALVLEMDVALMTMKMADSQVPALVLMKELVLVLVDGATAGDERLFGFKVKSFGCGRKLPASRDTGALNEKAPSMFVSGTTTCSATISTSLSDNCDSGSQLRRRIKGAG